MASVIDGTSSTPTHGTSTRGVQGDLAREYLTLTRGKKWTIMWLEKEPCAPYYWSEHEPMWTAQPGMASYAKRRNRVLVDWDLPYFDLTGHDHYTWYQIYDWSFDGQPAISTLTVDEQQKCTLRCGGGAVGVGGR